MFRRSSLASTFEEVVQSSAANLGSAYALALDEKEEEEEGSSSSFLFATSHSTTRGPCLQLWRTSQDAQEVREFGDLLVVYVPNQCHTSVYLVMGCPNARAGVKTVTRREPLDRPRATETSTPVTN